MFWYLLHHLQGDHCVTYSETICFLPRCYIDCAIECNVYPFFEMSTMNTFWVRGGGGKGDRRIELKTLPPSCVDCLETWEPQTPGTLRACTGPFRDCSLSSFLTFTIFVAVFKTTCSVFRRYRRTKCILY